MTVSTCFTQFKLPRVRATLLNSCGVVQSTCASVSTSGIITVAETKTYEDRVDFYVKNGDGEFCVKETDPPKLKWMELTLTFCNVDPQLVNLLTGEPIVLDDSEEPVAVGYRGREGSVATANFGFEGWTRITNNTCVTPQYGYTLYPWLVEGRIGDITYGNEVANFVVTARTHPSSPWGTGPYNVNRSKAAATLDFPLPLLTAIDALDHKDMHITELPPPPSACGCTDIPPATLGITNLALVATVTFPSPSTTLPAVISWGDGTFTEVTSGVDEDHTYGAAGTYVVSYAPKNYSSAPWTGSITVA